MAFPLASKSSPPERRLSLTPQPTAPQTRQLEMVINAQPVSLQQLACHAVLDRGNDVATPRNLARSVTVE